MRLKINITVAVNRIVKYFVLSDFFLIAGWGFIEPVFAIFIIQRIHGATLATVGISAAIYWILKSALQIPFANFLDKRTGEHDDFLALVGGLLVTALAAFSFSWVTETWQLYVVQVAHAVGLALYVPSWSAIFSRHLDKERISFDWSLDSTVAGLAAGVSGLLSGIIATFWGFTSVFILGGALSMGAAIVLLLTPNLILPRATTKEADGMKDHTPKNLGI